MREPIEPARHARSAEHREHEREAGPNRGTRREQAAHPVARRRFVALGFQSLEREIELGRPECAPRLRDPHHAMMRVEVALQRRIGLRSALLEHRDERLHVARDVDREPGPHLEIRHGVLLPVKTLPRRFSPPHSGTLLGMRFDPAAPELIG